MQTLKIDLVSDIACPWCAIGFKRFDLARQQLEGELAFELEWHPFELAPDIPAEGGDIIEHLTHKYGSSEAELVAAQERIIEAARALDLDFKSALKRRAVNTFDAHRVLAWAKEQDRQTEFQLALFDAYFGKAENPSDPAVLCGIAENLGLDAAAIDALLASSRYAETVREEEKRFQQAGISAVPAFIVDQQYLISGGQEPQVFIDAFRKIAAEATVTV